MKNIPTEVLHTIVVVAETGSYFEASQRLKISQSAVAIHVHRIQKAAGCSVFEGGPGGTVPTPFGKSLVLLAREVLKAQTALESCTFEKSGDENIAHG